MKKKTSPRVRRERFALHRLRAKAFAYMAVGMAHVMWRRRLAEEGWRNVDRLNLYLAKRRLYDMHGGNIDLLSVKVSRPTLGPKATPENVMKELLKLDRALRTGDFEEVEFTDGDRTVSLGQPALPHNDTTVGRFDGPYSDTVANVANPDGSNVPAKDTRTMLERKDG